MVACIDAPNVFRSVRKARSSSPAHRTLTYFLTTCSDVFTFLYVVSVLSHARARSRPRARAASESSGGRGLRESGHQAGSQACRSSQGRRICSRAEGGSAGGVEPRPGGGGGVLPMA